MAGGTGDAHARLLSLVRGLLAPAGGVESIAPDAPLAELGMSSIKMVNLMLAIEAEFDLTIPQNFITPQNFRSLASIEAMLGQLTNPSA